MAFTPNQFADAPPEAWTKRYDYDGSGNLIYEGWAPAFTGAATSAAVWAIRKFTYSGSNLTTIQWADGDERNNNVWDNRASLTYK